ncbi:hypothetical protein LCGC14_2584560 [marine sediment metagenome]|uniref:Glycosyltransferase 2-like domain-containing protein n=1 Tax=marine sediment metagenome TaxID=412755 RepID=A0A0F9ADT4_9ZZZZ
MASEISFIIPSRNELKNLLWTLQSIFDKCEDDYEVIVVLNQCEQEDHDRLARIPHKELKIVRYDDQPSCWQARNKGAEIAEGKYLCLLDSHVMFKSDSLVNSLHYHREFEGILAYGLNYWLDHPARTLFQYRWQPEKFWGAWSRRKPEPPDFRILMSGMNMLIDKKVFEAIGGFHSALGIYGGGEPYIYFKSQMMGYGARCVPDFQVYHIAEKRGYSWNGDDLKRNFMIAAYALGGDNSFGVLYDHYFKGCNEVERYEERLAELRDEAIATAQADRDKIEATAKFTVDEILDDWREYAKVHGHDIGEWPT